MPLASDHRHVWSRVYIFFCPGLIVICLITEPLSCFGPSSSPSLSHDSCLNLIVSLKFDFPSFSGVLQHTDNHHLTLVDALLQPIPSNYESGKDECLKEGNQIFFPQRKILLSVLSENLFQIETRKGKILKGFLKVGFNLQKKL